MADAPALGAGAAKAACRFDPDLAHQASWASCGDAAGARRRGRRCRGRGPSSGPLRGVRIGSDPDTAPTMKVNVTAAPRSSVALEVELPADRLDHAVGDAVRRLSRRTRVPGFRPGKAPRVMLERVLGPGAVLDEAVEHLVEDAYREAMVDLRVLPLSNPSVDVTSAEEGKPLVFTATVQVRPEVRLGDYHDFNFTPEIETIDDAKVDKVIGELRDQNAILEPVEDRAAEKGDWAVIGFAGTRDGEAFEGGTAERMPLVLGEERLIPGFEDHLLGTRVGDHVEFDITFPEDYGEASLAGQAVHFAADVKELRHKVLPEADDEFARSMGSFDSLAGLREEIQRRLERNALDRARHEFADRIIDYAVANASFVLPEHLDIGGDGATGEGLPDVLVDQEVEVMHDEFRSSIARQGVTEEAYLKVTGQSPEDLHKEFRPRAEQRVKVLLVVSKIADSEGISIGDEEVEAEVVRARAQYADNRRLVGYFDSERGRNFIRSTLRRSRTVERLIDNWLVAHPEHPALPHADSEEDRSVIQTPAVAAAGSIGAADPAGVDAAAGPSEAEGEGGETPTDADAARDAAPVEPA